MNTLADTEQGSPAPDAVEGSPVRSRRWWFLVVVAVVIVGAMAAFLLNRPRAAATPDQFFAFSQKLGALSAPAGSFIAYDPNFSSYSGSAPQGAWMPIARDTWSNTANPVWWIAVRGWEITVPRGHEAEVCGQTVAWLATTGSELGLTSPGANENVPGCLSSVYTVRSYAGAANLAWSGRGTLKGDGQLRYGTVAEAFTGTRTGDVVIRVSAEASVSQPLPVS